LKERFETAKISGMPDNLQYKPHLKSRVLAPPEDWLEEWIKPILSRHLEIEQVYLLGDRARGPHGQKPDYSILLYAGYDRALELLTRLVRGEDCLRTGDGIIHVYVENYGATFCGIWGGALIPNELNREWTEGRDYLLWIERGNRARPLSERLMLPLERRAGERRSEISSKEPHDELQPIWKAVSSEERRRSDRRRDLQNMLPHLEDQQD
jgi:hypothetical protein